MNHNLFAALRAAFPKDLNATAIETDDGLHYSWSDLERASAMMANLLDSLHIPKGSRVAVQVEKSVEAVMLYLATLRAGYVFLPLNTAYQSAEIEYFIGNAEPAVVVCSSKNFGWVSKIAFKAGTQNVFTLDDNRTGSLLIAAPISGTGNVSQIGSGTTTLSSANSYSGGTAVTWMPDFKGAIASFWLVFFASFPAALPFMFIDDAMLALLVETAPAVLWRSANRSAVAISNSAMAWRPRIWVLAKRQQKPCRCSSAHSAL